MTAPLYRSDVLQRLVASNGPQIGEMTWHSIFLDDRIDRISLEHAQRIIETIRRHFSADQYKNLKCLEISAYVHYSMDIVAHEIGCQTFINDISISSLQEGIKFSNTAFGRESAIRVSADFHDLPFSDEYFDFVFISSSVHHSFRPVHVIEEMARVTKPGGIIQIENEPVGPTFCAYAYRGNRTDSLTPFEKALQTHGLHRMLSSAFYGSRPEHLFGMIENDRIPLDMYELAFAAIGETAELHLETGAILSDTDRAIMALERDSRLPTRIQALLKSAFDACAPSLGEADRLMGIRLLTEDELWLLCYRAASGLRRLPAQDAPGYQREVARLFGAALRATIRKSPTPRPAATTPFRRDMERAGPIWLDPVAVRPKGLDMSRPLVPDAAFDDPAPVRHVFPETDWIFYREPIGINSFLNRGPLAKIDVGASAGAERFCLLRFYAAAKECPYVVEFSASGVMLDRHVIAQAESRLARMIVPADATDIRVRIAGLDSEDIDDSVSLHLSLIRLFAIREEELAG